MTLVSAPRARVKTLDSLWWAAHAFKREFIDFRFEYPISVRPTAHLGTSLHYYVQSDRLFSDAMEMDPQGTPMQRLRIIGTTYNPAYVAWYGLMRLDRALEHADSAGTQSFLGQVEWLVTHGVRRKDDAIVWPYTFDWQEGHCTLRAPWISAMAQGLAMSALIRGYRITRRAQLLDLCYGAVRVFEEDIREGGVRTLESGHALYEEYPAYPLPRVLDGFLFSLLGLYDLSVETKDQRIRQLFIAGIDGLKHALPFWNYRNKWSWYGSHGCLCPPHYHMLNCQLLSVLGQLSSESILARTVELWSPARLLALDKLEIFLVFALTKNLARVRFRRGAR